MLEVKWLFCSSLLCPVQFTQKQETKKPRRGPFDTHTHTLTHLHTYTLTHLHTHRGRETSPPQINNTAKKRNKKKK